MFLDSQLQFSDDQAFSGAGNTASTNIVDLTMDRNIGKGEPMAVVFTVTVAADFADADEVYTFRVETAPVEGFAGASFIGTQIVDAADLLEGDKVVIPIGYDNQRFLRTDMLLAGTTPSITLSAFLQPMSMIDGVDDYESGFTVS